MRSIWKLPLYTNWLERQPGLQWSETVQVYRRWYNGRKWFKQKIRPVHLKFNSKSLNYKRKRLLRLKNIKQKNNKSLPRKR